MLTEVETAESGNIIGYSTINETFRYYQFKISMAEKELIISSAQHRKITEAITKRDADEAGKLMKQHVRRTFEGIFNKK